MHSASHRNEEIVHRYFKGEKLTKIASDYGLSKNRVRQIVTKYKQIFFRNIDQKTIVDLKKTPIRILNQNLKITNQFESNGYAYLIDILDASFIQLLNSGHLNISYSECEGILGLIEHIRLKVYRKQKA